MLPGTAARCASASRATASKCQSRSLASLCESTTTVSNRRRADTAAAWQARTAPIAPYYARFAYPGNPAAKVDGTRTLASNIADLSGLELAWRAYAKAEPQAKAADQQAFFRGWARVWPQQLAPATANAMASASPYSPGQWRANAPAMQSPAFGTAFGCKAGSAMVVPDADRLTIWR